MPACLNNLYAIILAAGNSSRLGTPKQLLEWRERPLLAHCLDTARSLLNDRIVVVLGAYADTIQSAIDLTSVITILNPDWQEGMASSIRAGIQALPDDADAALILLSDQPLVTAEHLQQLLQNWQATPTHIVASEYQEVLGVPALFPAPFFETLSSLTGDRGAKQLFTTFEHQLLKTPLAAAKWDIDTQEDVNRLRVLP